MEKYSLKFLKEFKELKEVLCPIDKTIAPQAYRYWCHGFDLSLKTDRLNASIDKEAMSDGFKAGKRIIQWLTLKETEELIEKAKQAIDEPD